MAGAIEILGLLFIVSVNSAIAALATRFLRVRMTTDWGSGLYIVLIVPVLLLVSTLVLSGVFALGPNLGSAAAVVVVTVVVPLSLGVAFDFFWMPAPEEVDLPETEDRSRVRRN